MKHTPILKRIVGDSVELTSKKDLALITASDLEYCWEQGGDAVHPMCEK